MSWECPRCRNFVVSHPTRCDLCGALRASETPGVVVGVVSGRALTEVRDLVTEAHVRALAIWYRLGAGILAGVLALMTIARLADLRYMYQGKLALLGSVGFTALIGGGIAVGLFILGRRLGALSNKARIAAVVVTGVSVLSDLLRLAAAASSGSGFAIAFTVIGVMISGAWSAAVLWVLLSSRAARICTPAYQDLIADRPDQEPRIYSSPFFWIPFAALMVFAGLFLVGMLGAGYNMLGR